MNYEFLRRYATPLFVLVILISMTIFFLVYQSRKCKDKSLVPANLAMNPVVT